MNKILKFVWMFLLAFKIHALATDIPLKVWVNEAIVNIYDFNDSNWLARQKDIGTYFTPEAWKVYLDAMQKSNIIKLVKDNHFNVSAVATAPPTVHAINASNFKASMPIIVQYKNKDDVQLQYLEITLQVIQVTQGGQRGYAILQFQSKTYKEPCSCHIAYQPKVTIV